MKDTVISSPGADIPDRDAQEAARSLAIAAFIISNAGMLLYMAMIQYLLVKIRFSKSKIKPPTNSETYMAVTALWVGHQILDSVLSIVIDIVVGIFSGESVGIQYRHFRLTIYNIAYWIHDEALALPKPWRDNFSLLFYQVSATWFISQSLFLIFDSVLPFLQEAQDIRTKINRVRRGFKIRFLELVEFMQTLGQKQTLKISGKPARIRKAGRQNGGRRFDQRIQLQRYHKDIPDKGQRTLNWDLMVDKKALEEMMETLGPPGGFGELGFNVAKDRVCFGAMGVGTRFNLTFVLDSETYKDLSLKS